jgi:hypothetical protein
VTRAAAGIRTDPGADGAAGEITPAAASVRLADFGFLATPDLPDRPGPASLLVAIRDRPTLRHYDPELVTYWVSEAGRGRPRTLTRDTTLPVHAEVSWGRIRLTDRLDVCNEYLTFGARLVADRVAGVVVACFTSDAPLLRSGGHSQGWDPGGEQAGAFFARLLLAVDYVPGFEARVAAADPLARFAAFVADTVGRYRASPVLRERAGELRPILEAEAARLALDRPEAWALGQELAAAIGR